MTHGDDASLRKAAKNRLEPWSRGAVEPWKVDRFEVSTDPLFEEKPATSSGGT